MAQNKKKDCSLADHLHLIRISYSLQRRFKKYKGGFPADVKPASVSGKHKVRQTITHHSAVLTCILYIFRKLMSIFNTIFMDLHSFQTVYKINLQISPTAFSRSLCILTHFTVNYALFLRNRVNTCEFSPGMFMNLPQSASLIPVPCF